MDIFLLNRSMCGDLLLDSNLHSSPYYQSLIFICDNFVGKEYIDDYIDIFAKTYHERDMADLIFERLSAKITIHQRDFTKMLPNWPNNVIEEWADRVHSQLDIEFKNNYNVYTLQHHIRAKAIGTPTVDIDEYLDTYHQAQTMMKLGENL